MTDVVDFAQVVEEADRERALAQVQGAAAELAVRAWPLCLDCADPIDEARLHAVPGAGRCIHCQEARERRFRQYPGG
ncbi:TraR/DksA C4-type zinc finger protein [Phenylobacterium sp.]|jgi:phage/conjugal plasmid C-4 type zinc finger TraR family protein|uniref:TraR/DksA C4-type zinc finger protein n=1 Tax=Phenylobacterium sp. TaxID=1871053 RepID=UPI002F41A65F